MPDNALVLISPAPVTVGRAGPVGAGGSLWMTTKRPTMDSRERLGMGTPPSMNGSPVWALHHGRNLLPIQYWQLYRTSPDVRACVDSIVRRIATWDWSLEVKADPRNAATYERLRARADEGERWLQVPNGNGETWQEVMTRTVTDLLLYDAGACELNMSGTALLELVPWLGSEWIPTYDAKGALLYYLQTKDVGVYDATGSLQYYRQTKEGGVAGDAELPPERMLYLSLFRNNRSPLGLPLLDTLVNECVTVLLASEHAMLSLDADEIPPGLLVLGGVAGAAAERARADLQQMRGKDHRLRVVSSPQPAGIKAEWVELRHKPKDLQMLEVVDKMQRVIWRTFGVMPVELGVADGIPRASATVQVDVSASHLITPILELIQARLNAQVIPLLLGADAAQIRFEFDRTQPLSPKQKLELAQAQDLQVRRGLLTVNEARADLRRLPLDGGDVAIVDTNEGPVPLADVAKGLRPSDDPPSDDPPSNDPPDDDDGGGGGGGTPPAGEEIEVQAALEGLQLALVRQRLAGRAADWLPSDWPAASRWDSYRTIDVRALGRVVGDYGHDVAGLYSLAVADLQVLLANGYGGDQQMSVAESLDVKHRMDTRLNQLADEWSALSLPLYQRAAKIGADGAASVAGGPVDIDHAARAESYHEQAMAYLTQPQGLIGTMRELCRRTVDAVTLPAARARHGHEHGPLCGCGPMPGLRDRIDELGPDSAPSEAMGRMEASLVGQAHRIENWSGRMVGLANTVLVDALNKTASQQDGTPVEWQCEWVNAGGRTCPICMDEGAQGFRPIGQLTRRPGEDTYCVGNCRCVLVFWTTAEVNGGGAVKLSALAPGGPDA